MHIFRPIYFGFAMFPLDVFFRHIDIQEKVFIHASMIHLFFCISACL